MSLTVAQAIGIGIVVGFVAFGGAYLLSRFICTRPIPGMVVRDGEPVSVVPETSQKAQKPTQKHVRPFERMTPMFSLEDVEATVSFEKLIWSFVDGCLVNGFRDPPDVPESLFDEDELVRLAGDPKNGGTWSSSISNIATRGPAVQCFLAQFVLKRLDPYCPPQESLLPAEVASCYQLICKRDNVKDWKDLIGVWRECTFLLLQQPLSLHPPEPQLFKKGDPRKERTRAMVFLIIDALRLESLRVDQSLINEAFKDLLDWNLTGILESAANGGLRLLAQPGEWEAVWEWKKSEFIVFPEIRFVWDGDTMLHKRGTVIKLHQPGKVTKLLQKCGQVTKLHKGDKVDADIVKPIPSDNKQHQGVDGAEQPNSDAEKLPSLEDGHSLTAKTSQEPGPSTASQ